MMLPDQGCEAAPLHPRWVEYDASSNPAPPVGWHASRRASLPGAAGDDVPAEISELLVDALESHGERSVVGVSVAGVCVAGSMWWAVAESVAGGRVVVGSVCCKAAS